MSKEEILANYKSLSLTDKLILTMAILYDLDVGDYSASEENRRNDWDEAFGIMQNHLEDEIGKRLSDKAVEELEKKANEILKDH